MTTQESNQREGKLRDLLILVPYVKQHQLNLWLSIALMIISSVISIALPMFIRRAVDVHIMGYDLPGLLLLTSIAFGLILVTTSANIFRGRLMAKLGQNSIRALRDDLFAYMQRLPVKFFDKIPVGKLITRLTSDVDALRDLVGNAIVSMVIDTLRLTGFLALMFWLDWRLTLITLTLAPILVFALTFLTARIRKAEDQVREQASLVNANLQESISGIRVIQGFQAEDYFHEQFKIEDYNLLRAGMRAVATYAYFWPTIDLSGLSTAAIFYFGGQWVMDGTATPGSGGIYRLHRTVLWAAWGLSQAYRIIQRALAGAVRIKRIMATETEEKANLNPMPRITAKLSLKI